MSTDLARTARWDVARMKGLTPTWAKSAARVSTHALAVATAPIRGLPDFLIIGTKRGGTTSLWNYLVGHPAVLSMYPSIRGQKSPAYFFEHYDRGEAWYRAHFHTRSYKQWLEHRRGSAVVTGEASPYYLYGPHIADRVRTLVPNVRLIVLLRNPVKRAYSHYWERVGQGVEPLSFEEALEAEPSRTEGEWDRMLADPSYYSRAHDFYSYRDRGVYRPQLERWFDEFPRDQLLVLQSERFYRDTQQAYDEVCEFLEIPRCPVPSSKQWNRQAPPPMREETRHELAEFYTPHNQRLFELLGEDFGWNNNR